MVGNCLIVEKNTNTFMLKELADKIIIGSTLEALIIRNYGEYI